MQCRWPVAYFLSLLVTHFLHPGAITIIDLI